MDVVDDILFSKTKLRARDLNTHAKFLHTLMQKALAAVKPEKLVAAHLSGKAGGPVTVVGMGKAAANMALGAEQALGTNAQGVVVVPHGFDNPCQWIKVLYGAHPMADKSSVLAAQQIRHCLQTTHHPVLGLISGGGSSLFCSPAEFITLQEKQLLIHQLMRNGATIGQLNQVRSCLSQVKAGGLANMMGEGRGAHILVLSDVPGDLPDLVASGPFAQTKQDGKRALAIFRNFNIPVSKDIVFALQKLSNQAETNKNIRTCLIGKNATALQAAAKWSRKQGVKTILLSDKFDEDAVQLAKLHADVVVSQCAAHPVVLLSGGEATTKITGNGKGGTNRHFLLALMLALRGKANVVALAIDTDGVDGNDNQAGAWSSSQLFEHAIHTGQTPEKDLKNNDSARIFKKMGTSIHTGPTGTNVNDFRAILVLPERN